MTLTFHPSDRSFNRDNALFLAHASELAYKRAPIAEVKKRLGLDAVPFLSHFTRTRGFLGVCDDYAVLAFRGSDPATLPNWVTDVIVKLVECEHYEGRVHHGFSSALRRAWAKVEKTLEMSGSRPLFITGHSMGGALAVLTACRLAKLGRPPIATYTYGAPRVGDRTFCSGYGIRTYRIVNGLDLVPEMPLASVKRLLPSKARITNEKLLEKLKRAASRVRCYGHVKTFVYIDRDGTIVTDAQIEPWHTHAVAHAIATRGKSFVEGITDHLISNYIRALEGTSTKRATGNRRRLPID